jgi:hypothetical protein
MDAAQIPVSMLGVILSNTFFPLKSFKRAVDRSVLTSLNFGAFFPTLGSLPMVLILFPFSVILAMMQLLVNGLILIPNLIKIKTPQKSAEFYSFKSGKDFSVKRNLGFSTGQWTPAPVS